MKISACDNSLELTTTDLEVSMTYRMVCTEVSEPGTIVCSENKIASIIKEWSNNTIEIIENEKVCEITCKDDYFKILCADPEEFPVIPTFIDENYVEIESRVFANMIRKTMFIALGDRTKSASSGIFFHISNDEAKMVANDGRRLAEIKKKINNPGGLTKSCIIPIKGISQILKILSDQEEVIRIKVDEKRILVKSTSSTFCSQLIDGRYPDYEKIIPSDMNKPVTLNKAEFSAAVRKGAIMTIEDYKLLCFKFFNNMLEITCSTPDVGESKVSMVIEYSDEELEIGFNPDYILDFMRVVDNDHVLFELRDKKTAGIFKVGDDYQYMVMPLKLRESDN